jgi:hypothetical protein
MRRLPGFAGRSNARTAESISVSLTARSERRSMLPERHSTACGES